MKVFHDLSAWLHESGPLCVAIGFFDGLHRGHARVIAAAQRRADAQAGQAWVMTFDPHPAVVLNPDAAPRLLTTLGHKLRLFERVQVEGCMVVPFTKTFAQHSPETFVRTLANNAPQLSDLFVGLNWRFGKDRQGDVALLKTLAREHGIGVTTVPYSKHRGEPISSTRIRSAIMAGDLDIAAAMQGRPFSVIGTIARGQQMGRELGYPTANVETRDVLMPPYGIYAAYALLRDGTPQPGVVSYGVRPTFFGKGKSPAVFELHVFDYEGDLYGSEAEVFLMGRIRDELAFKDADALRTAMANDAVEAQRILRRKKLKESLYTPIDA
jgi:riboflavin kinase/FMN adenylyltransferase